MDALETPVPPRHNDNPDRTEPRPLLPPPLLGPGTILWLWIVPMLVLLALNVQGYLLIEGNMDDGERGSAWLLGAAGLASLLAGAVVWSAMRRTRATSAWWGLPAVLVQAGYLWLVMSMGDDLLPETVTQWIYTPERFMYNQFAFVMPALFWGMTRLACARPSGGGRVVLKTGLAMAVGAPLALFFVFQLLSRTAGGGMGDVGVVLVTIMIVAAGVLMFVGLIRVLAAGLRDMQHWSPTAECTAIFVFAFGMPIAGLLLNGSIPFPNDFQAWEVYTLTVLNAVLLMTASFMHRRNPLLSHGLLCATLPFTLYFFVVFLPFLPLSVLAVVLFGSGFLVLTPTVLLVLHLSLLNKSRAGSFRARLAVGLVCFALLPGFFTVRGLADKAALNAALDHVYAPTIAGGDIVYGASRVNLKRALANHRSYKNGIYYPLLSDYYAWLVFDHLVLPDDKLDRLETVFFDEAASRDNKDRVVHGRGSIWGSSRSSVRDRNRMPRTNPPPRDVVVERLDVETKPTGGDATTLTMTLTLRNTTGANAEYVKLLPLPAGVYVSGFRLHVNGEPVSGRITEKKTALWVYSMIRDTERRDPGLLFYNAPDELELRVFPVSFETPSVVEIDFLVPATLPENVGPTDNDPERVLTWAGQQLHPRLARNERGVVLAGGLERLALPAAKRAPYAHVIVDRSERNGFDGDLASALARVRERFPDVRETRVTLANYETHELASAGEGVAALPLRGGFVADTAIAKAIRAHAERDLDGRSDGTPAPYPVFVVLAKRTKPLTKTELKLTAGWTDLLPRLEIHGLDAAGDWKTLSAEETKDVALLRLGASQRPLVNGNAVRFAAGAGAEKPEYWNMDTRSWLPIADVRTAGGDTSWSRATALQSKQRDLERMPGNAGVDLKALVKESRKSGVMVASTSYIVVENAAQWRMLDVSERKKLDQNAALEFKEAPTPPATWLIAGFGVWLAWRARRRRGNACGCAT